VHEFIVDLPCTAVCTKPVLKCRIIMESIRFIFCICTCLVYTTQIHHISGTDSPMQLQACMATLHLATTTIVLDISEI